MQTNLPSLLLRQYFGHNTCGKLFQQTEAIESLEIQYNIKEYTEYKCCSQ